MNFSVKSLSQVTLIVVATTVSSMAEGPRQRQRPVQVTIDADVLAAFVDEPCHHFEQARNSWRARDGDTAASELRTAAAFLKLEAARSTPQGRRILETSIRELERLAVSVKNDQVRSAKVLEQTFARAHFALAEHHCIKSAHRCCRPATFENKQEMARAGHDLKAATTHLKRGSIWGGNDLDQATQKMLDSAQRSAGSLINNTQPSSQNQVTRSVHSIHRKLEALTGRKISIGLPLAGDDKLRPGFFE